MTSGIIIDSPYTLATLPRPLNLSLGQILATPVLGVRPDHISFTRRKRTEVAVGIDGVGINLYDIRSSRLITSYSLPPQAALTCPPCSTRYERVGGSAQRVTYASIISPKPQIALFRHESPRTPIVATISDLPDSASPIRYLDILPWESAEGDLLSSISLVAVHEDGAIRCLKGDLTKEQWVEQTSAFPSTQFSRIGTTSELCVEHVAMTDAATARKGLIRDREDIQALITTSPEDARARASPNPASGEDDPQLKRLPVLVIVGRSCGPQSDHQRRTVYIFCIRSLLRNISTAETHSSPYLLASYRLPKTVRLSARSLLTPQYSLHPAKGTLSVLLADQIITYDLSGSTPKLSSELRVGQTRFDSFVRLSTGFVLATSSQAIGVYDIKFQSLQATLPLSKTFPVGTSNNKKRKLEGSPSPSLSHFKAISFFEKQNLVVGLADGALVGIQVSLPSSRGAHNRRVGRSGRLIDAIGRGLTPHIPDASSLPTDEELPQQVIAGYLPSSLLREDKGLAVEKDNLDNFVKFGDVDSFERTIANLLGIEREETPLREWNMRKHAWEREQASNAIHDTGSTNGLQANSDEGASPSLSDRDNEEFAEEKPLPQWKKKSFKTKAREKAQPLDEIVQYIINKVFGWKTREDSASLLDPDGSVEPSLHITFYAPNVLSWLINSGNFTFDYFRSTLQLEQGNTPNDEAMARILINSFIDIDPELRLLHSLLIGPVSFDAQQLTQVVKHILQSLEYVQRPPHPPISGFTRDGAVLVNGNLEAALNEEEDAAELDIDIALNTLESGSVIREQVLTLALLRLNTKDARNVTAAFRAGLTVPEIASLIHILRRELATGGWTSRYLDADAEESQAQVDTEQLQGDRSVMLVVNLLNCAIDAINIPGWTLSNLKDNEKLIAMLKLEVSAALEGIEEATYLRGLLQDVLLFERAVRESAPKPAAGGKVETGQGMSRPITLPMGGSSQGQRLLPLGLKVEQVVGPTKVGVGGDVSRRSARTMGMLKSRMVGMYSRERIVL